jgi:branched-chain amino acid transport system substrate-binding protein
VLSACGGNDNNNAQNSPSNTPTTSESSSSSPPPTTTSSPLIVGELLPQTGDLAFLGPPEFAGVKTAIGDINSAGGVLGKPVQVFSEDSGDGTPDIAGGSVSKLIQDKANVIIGAAASGVSLSVIDQITSAGIVQFSPANTSPALDDPSNDPHNLYFRTAPSDVLQGAVMAQTVLGDGFNNVAIMARQDSYGELLAQQVAKGIKAGGGQVSADVLYSPDATNYTAEINKIAASKPDALVLIAFSETTKIIPALTRAGVGPQDEQMYFVDGNTADYSKDFPKGTLTGVKATYPGAQLTSGFKDRLLQTDPKLTDFTYGPESYDATILTALAADEAGSTDGKTFAPHIITVSKDGTKCTTYADCLNLINQGTDIDYDGVSGPCDLGATGSPTKATIGIFQYSADNTYHNLKYVTGVIPG